MDRLKFKTTRIMFGTMSGVSLYEYDDGMISIENVCIFNKQDLVTISGVGTTVRFIGNGVVLSEYTLSKHIPTTFIMNLKEYFGI